MASDLKQYFCSPKTVDASSCEVCAAANLHLNNGTRDVTFCNIPGENGANASCGCLPPYFLQNGGNEMACANLVVFTGYGFPGVLIAAVGLSLFYLLSYEIWLIRAKCRSQRRRCRCSYIIGSVVCVFCFSLVRTVYFFVDPFSLLDLPGNLNNLNDLLNLLAGDLGASAFLLYVFACKAILRKVEKEHQLKKELLDGLLDSSTINLTVRVISFNVIFNSHRRAPKALG